MIVPDLDEGIERLSAMLDAASFILPFTGAGISTECGIPDFRSPGGMWTKNKPIDYGVFLADPAMRVEAWRRRLVMDKVFAAARPGSGHAAIAHWHESGKAPHIITQNIDNLHQLSGVAPECVLELHGNTTYARCVDCRTHYALDWVWTHFHPDHGRAPECAACSGPVKTATVSFGEPMPQAIMRQAAELARACDLFIVMGSSLKVWPAAGLPVLAKEAGAKLIIINREPTEQDEIADLVLHHAIHEVVANVPRPLSVTAHG